MNFKSIKLQSFIMSAAPVIMGSAMAYGDGVHHIQKAIVCLFTVLFLHFVVETTNAYRNLHFALRDIFLLILLGPVAVSLTYYAQSCELNNAIIFAGFGPGLISYAISSLNNIINEEEDKRNNKKTSVIVFGKHFAQMEYVYCIMIASIIPVIIYNLIHDHINTIITPVLILIAIPSIKEVLVLNNKEKLNRTLTFSYLLLAIYTGLFSIGWMKY